MLVHLNLAREFRGRVYATGNPQACFELGGGNSEMTLRIPLGTQCGTVQQVISLFHMSIINYRGYLGVFEGFILRIKPKYMHLLVK